MMAAISPHAPGRGFCMRRVRWNTLPCPSARTAWFWERHRGLTYALSGEVRERPRRHQARVVTPRRLAQGGVAAVLAPDDTFETTWPTP
jgi:hypothetical protein